MERYSKIALMALLERANNFCEERRKVGEARFLLSHIIDGAVVAIDGQTFDNGDYSKLIEMATHTLNFINSDSATVTETLLFYRDSLGIFRIYHRRDLNQITLRAINILNDRHQLFVRDIYGDGDIPSLQRKLIDEFNERSTAMINTCNGGEEAVRNLEKYLTKRESLLETAILNGMPGLVARQYWSAITGNQNVNAAYNALINGLSERLLSVTDMNGMPCIIRRTHYDEQCTTEKLQKALKACFSFLLGAMRLVENSNGADATFCDAELNYIEASAGELMQYVNTLRTSSNNVAYYDMSAMLRAKCSRIL